MIMMIHKLIGIYNDILESFYENIAAVQYTIYSIFSDQNLSLLLSQMIQPKFRFISYPKKMNCKKQGRD
jgi:hypothetical protein